MDLLRPVGVIRTLDIETRPDPYALRIAGKVRPTGGIGMQKIRNVSILSARETDQGHWTDLSLSTVRNADEFDLLMDLDRLLETAGSKNQLICSYNGTGHDLATIRRRASALWMFGLPGLASLTTSPHVDIFHAHLDSTGGKWPSLREVCASYRIPTDHFSRLDDGNARDSGERKSEVDVVATFILFLFELASARGTDRPLVKGWGALIDYIRAERRDEPHLEQFCHLNALQVRLNDRQNTANDV